MRARRSGSRSRRANFAESFIRGSPGNRTPAASGVDLLARNARQPGADGGDPRFRDSDVDDLGLAAHPGVANYEVHGGHGLAVNEDGQIITGHARCTTL